MSVGIPQISFAGGWISQSIIERMDLAKYSTAAQELTNCFVHVEGGVSNRAGLEFIAEVKDSTKQTRLIPFRFNEVQTYALEFGHQYMRVIKDGGYVLSASVPYELSTPYASTDTSLLKFRQSYDIVYMAHKSYELKKLGRTAHDAWTLSNVSFQPDQAAPTSPSISNVGTAGSTTYNYKISAVNDDTREESVTVSVSTGTGNATLSDTDFNRITFTAASGAGEYNVYKEDNGIYGFIGRTETTQFDDTNIKPDLNDTPPKQINPFTSSSNYPGAVGLHEQRAVFGPTTNKPLTTWLSQTGQYENLNTSTPSKSSDGMELRIATGQGNEIRHYSSHDERLFVMTSGSIMSISPGGDSDAITASSKKLRVEDRLPVSNVPPLEIRDKILVFSGKESYGNEVHSLGYSLDKDGYSGSDLTVFAKDLFNGHTIIDSDYLEAPYNLVCAIRDDGKLLVMTYHDEHRVYAWSLWETDGEFESICRSNEYGEDAGYFVVKRTINGQTKRYIERLHTRDFTNIEDAFFVDSGLTYDGAATDTLSGFDHLEGETVIALADGNLIEGLTVSSGTVTLPKAYSKVHVGLPYEGVLQTLPIVFTRAKANVQAPTEALVRLIKTRGLRYGVSLDDLDELPSRSDELWGQPAKAKSKVISVPISADYEHDNSLYFSSVNGLPMTILSVTPKVDVGG